MRRVRLHADFKADLRACARWLAEGRDTSALDRLREGIDEAAALVARFPAVGTIEVTEDGAALRRLILRRVPYVIWFVSEPENATADVWFLRLFHARQERPSPSDPRRLQKVG